MNRRLRDRCPACGKNGLEPSSKEKRRRCLFCREEELRPCDRVLYSVCRGDAHYVDGKGWYLPGWRPFSEPTFSRERATRELAEAVAEAASARSYAHIKSPFGTENLTIRGKAGTVVYTNGGPEFYFVSEQVVDVSDIINQG